jgi:hypothetical protein
MELWAQRRAVAKAQAIPEHAVNWTAHEIDSDRGDESVYEAIVLHKHVNNNTRRNFCGIKAPLRGVGSTQGLVEPSHSH